MSETGTDVVDEGGRWTLPLRGDVPRPYPRPGAHARRPSVSHDAPDDHPWHHGLWFTIKFVNGDNFWEEYDTYGVLRHRAEPSVGLDGAVTGEIEWIAPDRETVVIDERRTWHTTPIDDTTYAVDFSTHLAPLVDVTLDRTPFTTWGGYGGLSLRGPADWHDTRLLTADGLTHDRVLGDPFRWCSARPTGGRDRRRRIGHIYHPNPTTRHRGTRRPGPTPMATRAGRTPQRRVPLRRAAVGAPGRAVAASATAPSSTTSWDAPVAAAHDAWV